MFGEDDLKKVEAKMTELAKKNEVFVRKDISKKDAIDFFTKKGDPYKLELLEGLSDGSITFYEQGNFTDLCRGPHIPNTGPIKAIKLLNVAGAYWRGDEKNKMLTRVYESHSLKQRSWKNTSTCWRKQRSATIASLARSLSCLLFLKSGTWIAALASERNCTSRTTGAIHAQGTDTCRV